MGTPCYVGTTDPDQPTFIRARYVHFDGYPSSLLPQLRAIWASTARRDTATLIEVVLAHDWEHLGPEVTPGGSFAGQRRIAGVGMTLDDTEPQPVTVFPLSRAVGLGAEWIYVINPADDTVSVYSGDGEAVGVHHLKQPRDRQLPPAR